MPYNIVLTTGQMDVLFDDGETGVWNLATMTSVAADVSRTPMHVPGSVVGTMTVDFRERWFVLLHFSDGSEPYRIWMGKVDNQGGWVNTQIGANQCVTDIQAVIP